MLNGKRVDIPSIRVVPGDEVVIRESSKSNNYFKNIDELSPPISDTSAWLKVDRKNLKYQSLDCLREKMQSQILMNN